MIVYFTKADRHGVKIVKHIKEGINPSSAHQLQLTGPHVGQAAKAGLISAIIALAEAIAVGRSFASIKGYHLDGNKEMLAMGCMNIVGSLTSCYVATSSFSRTAVDKLDFLACIGAFLGVMFASVEIGLLAAVTISFAKILVNSLRPGIEVLGRLPRSDIFCNINQYPMAIKTPSILIIGINSSLLCFANANSVRERVMKWVTKEEDDTEEKEKGRNIQHVILDMSNVMNVDTSGILALEEIHKKLLSHGIELAVANPRWQVIHRLKLAKLVDKIGGERIYLTIGEAVDDCLMNSKGAGGSSC
ncbi:hypothetical protein M0R45_001346 [Rubus argutus]|uniref:STAS domain-containing protein n=1 Tax=Rubus argutus TaxID=59490 RepID=A0AAW1VLT1_RUBAR